MLGCLSGKTVITYEWMYLFRWQIRCFTQLKRMKFTTDNRLKPIFAFQTVGTGQAGDFSVIILHVAPPTLKSWIISQFNAWVYYDPCFTLVLPCLTLKKKKSCIQSGVFLFVTRYIISIEFQGVGLKKQLIYRFAITRFIYSSNGFFL